MQCVPAVAAAGSCLAQVVRSPAGLRSSGSVLDGVGRAAAQTSAAPVMAELHNREAGHMPDSRAGPVEPWRASLAS